MSSTPSNPPRPQKEFDYSGCNESNDWRTFTDSLIGYTEAQGFPITGITDVLRPQRYAKFTEWLERGFAGTMHYLDTRREAYQHASSVLQDVRSIFVLGMPYSKSLQSSHADSTAKTTGQVARYASGTRDYHDVIRERLHKVSDWIQEKVPHAQVRGIVDTAPLLERDFANLAGLGWIGKNTLLLNRTYGSYFFIAALLTNLPLSPNVPFATDHCGTCRACLDACPTQAFPEPYVLDATRCISYLTIEHRGSIDASLTDQIGDRIFGCDVCQEVCPWNRKPTPEVDAELQSTEENSYLSLLSLLEISPTSFRDRFRKTPLWRSHWEGLVRNAIIAAGNQRLQQARPALERLVANEQYESIRVAAFHALRQLDNHESPDGS